MTLIRYSVTAALLSCGALCLCTACGTQPVSHDFTTVRVNELCASNRGSPDDLGNTGDWIELVNLDADPVNLEGYYISDDVDTRFVQQLPADAVVPGHGLLLLWADAAPERGPLHLAFKLSADGEGVWFSNPQGYLVDSIEFGVGPMRKSDDSDASFARFPDATGDFGWCSLPTPGESNGSRCANPLP